MLRQMEETLNCRLLSMGLQSLENGGRGQCYFFAWASIILKHPQRFSDTKFTKAGFLDLSVPALAQKIREWTVGELRQSVEYKKKFDEFYPDEVFEVFLCDMAKPHTHVNELVIRFVSEIMGFYQEIISCDTITHIEPRSGVGCCDANTIQLASRRERSFHANGVTHHQSGHYMEVEHVSEAEIKKILADASSWTFVGQQPVNDTDQLMAIALSDVERRISEAGLKLKTMMRKLSADLSAPMQATAAAPQVAGLTNLRLISF